jgi:hypothetical protein
MTQVAIDHFNDDRSTKDLVNSSNSELKIAILILFILKQD